MKEFAHCLRNVRATKRRVDFLPFPISISFCHFQTCGIRIYPGMKTKTIKNTAHQLLGNLKHGHKIDNTNANLYSRQAT